MHDLWTLRGVGHPAENLPVVLGCDAAGYDETMRVTTEQGWDMSERLAREEALFVGHSSGANVFAAVEIAKRLHATQGGGCVVAIVADRSDRYFAPMKWEKKYLW